MSKINSYNFKGNIYLIECNGFYKIGLTSSSPNERMKKMQSGNPYKLNLIHSFIASSMEDAENFLHNKFNHARLEGEWFMLNEREVNFIKSINEFSSGAPIHD